MHRRGLLFIVLIAALGLGSACKRGAVSSHEYAYVSVGQANVRDRLAVVYNKVAVVDNGDKVEITDRQKRFVKIKTAGGQEGWLEARYVVSQDIYNQFQSLKQKYQHEPAQGHGTARAELNVHLTPERDSEHLYRLKDGEKVDVLERGVGEKKSAQQVSLIFRAKPQRVSAKQRKGRKSKPGAQSAVAPAKPAQPEVAKAYEDWWLVRSAEGNTGWVLARMIDLDVPLEISQYAEGQRIMGYHILNKVDEDGKQIPQYLVLTNENKDGLPWDFNAIRVFSRNRARHRYETAYRERNLFGVFPVKTGTEEFEKEGTLPYFVIRVKDAAGNIVEKKYKMNGPIVRRVLSPQEQAKADAERDKAIAERKARLEQLRVQRTAKHAATPSRRRHR
jgi:SH3-like domain-containing protein